VAGGEAAKPYWISHFRYVADLNSLFFMQICVDLNDYSFV
jgi:hypothetical protein